MACDYCTLTLRHALKPIMKEGGTTAGIVKEGADYYVMVDNKAKDDKGYDVDIQTWMKVNHCPMCGRKLANAGYTHIEQMYESAAGAAEC